VGDILVTVDERQFNAEPRCAILAAVAEFQRME
jgi:hypothetical protein